MKVEIWDTVAQQGVNLAAGESQTVSITINRFYLALARLLIV